MDGSTCLCVYVCMFVVNVYVCPFFPLIICLSVRLPACLPLSMYACAYVSMYICFYVCSFMYVHDITVGVHFVSVHTGA